MLAESAGAERKPVSDLEQPFCIINIGGIDGLGVGCPQVVPFTMEDGDALGLFGAGSQPVGQLGHTDVTAEVSPPEGGRLAPFVQADLSIAAEGFQQSVASRERQGRSASPRTPSPTTPSTPRYR
jgi:hypothetical protein